MICTFVSLTAGHSTVFRLDLAVGGKPRARGHGFSHLAPPVLQCDRPRGPCGLEAKLFGFSLGLTLSGLGLDLGLMASGLIEIGLVASNIYSAHGIN